MDPAIVAFGLGVGVLVGMTGIGGGSLMTPLLILVFGIKPVTAVGTDLAYGAVTKTLGGWRHLRQGTVDMTLSWWMAVGSVPAAVGGVYILELLERAYGDEFDELLIVVLAITLLFTGVMTLTRALFLKALHDKERHSIEMTTRNKVNAIVLGAKRRCELEEGAVRTDVEFVQGQVVDRCGRGDGEAGVLRAS